MTGGKKRTISVCQRLHGGLPLHLYPHPRLGRESECVRVDGMGWDGMGWDGMGWDGMGWDGMGWDGMGWDGMIGG